MPDHVERQMARERERFLSSGRSPAQVRAEVYSSWRRCLSWSVPTEGLNPPFRPDVDRESRLLRAASPVLDVMDERLGELGISFILTDSDARILDRRVRGGSLTRALDAMNVAPGFVFAEDVAGTNGLGTAIELGRTTRIDGYEHYASDLTRFTCVGVPIMDRMAHRTLGVLDVTCAADHDNTLVTLIAEQTARSIESRLLDQHTLLERALLARFLETSRHSHRGVVVLNERVLMANPQATRLLEGVDQPRLWDRAARAVAAGEVVEETLEFADGRTVRTHITALRDGGEVIGALMEIRPRRERRAPMPEREIPVNGPQGLVGADPAFLQAYRMARRAPADRVLTVYGEAGSGKFALLMALQQRDLSVHDAAAAELEGEEAWLGSVRGVLGGRAAALLVRHVDLLSATSMRALGAMVGTATARGWRCSGTVTVAWPGGAVPRWAGVDQEEVRLPPLRSRLGDVPALVAAFAAPRQVGAEVVQLLQRLRWPGNVGELRTAVRRIVAATPPGTRSGLAHVPAEIATAAPRRTLSRFERAEVHAILETLAETGGNKKDAAALLGISRSTLYRKLQAAGLDLENTTY